MRFKPGQEVVCVTNQWEIKKKFLFINYTSSYPFGPRKNEIVTVKDYRTPGMIRIQEYLRDPKNGADNAYMDRAFEPVMPQEQIEELMLSLNQPVL